MSPDAQRIAIAKTLGLTKEIDYFLSLKGKLSIDSILRDYPDDLNAMHEAETAETVLTEEQREMYRSILVDVVRGTVDRLRIGWQAALCHATAAQRAEAFLRTLKLWDDSK